MYLFTKGGYIERLGGTVLHWVNQLYWFKMIVFFGGREPEIQFGRLSLNHASLGPGYDLWEANSETGR